MFNSLKERYDDFLALCEKNKFYITDEVIQWLKNNQFFTAPASTKYHGVYEGGLYDHCRCVYDRLISLTENNHLIWHRPQSPFVIGMFHDLCKCDQYIPVYEEEYISNKKGKMVPSSKIVRYEYNENTLLKGHGSKSVILLASLFTLTNEEAFCIRYHMGPYEKEEWKEYDLAIHTYPNVLWTHHADMLASKVDDV